MLSRAVHRIRRNGLALVAVFVALGGTSYAVVRLPRDSVGSAQIKQGAVRSSEVKDGSLRARDFSRGALPRGARGATGPTGPAGPAGAAGPAGESGSSEGFAASFPDTSLGWKLGARPGALDLQPGAYFVSATAYVVNPDPEWQRASCSLAEDRFPPPGAAEADSTIVNVGPSGGSSPLVLHLAITLSAPASVRIDCPPLPAPPREVMQIRDVDMIAIRLGRLTG